MKSGFPLGKNITHGGLLPFVGRYGKAGIDLFFEKKLIKSPLEIVCHAGALMIYWSGLYAELDQDQLVEGANTMLRVAKEILVAQTTRQVNQLLLQDGESSEHDGDPNVES